MSTNDESDTADGAKGQDKSPAFIDLLPQCIHSFPPDSGCQSEVGCIRRQKSIKLFVIITHHYFQDFTECSLQANHYSRCWIKYKPTHIVQQLLTGFIMTPCYKVTTGSTSRVFDSQIWTVSAERRVLDNSAPEGTPVLKPDFRARQNCGGWRGRREVAGHACSYGSGLEIAPETLSVFYKGIANAG